jgi:hypothetical protein
MRKRIVGSVEPAPEPDPGWLDLQELATVEVVSEASGFPIESVFIPGPNGGWRSGVGGKQRVRVIFDKSTRIRVIELQFAELESARTQEFQLGWSAAEGGPIHEIVRQQWTFSPEGSTQEVERYEVNLDAVSTVELSITPDISNPNAKATLLKWRMG